MYLNCKTYFSLRYGTFGTEELVNEGAEVVAHDPAGAEHAKGLLPAQVQFAPDAQGCIVDADVTVILTEWDMYRQLQPGAFAAMRRPVVVDMRNLYNIEAMQKAGVSYYSLGRPAPQA